MKWKIVTAASIAAAFGSLALAQSGAAKSGAVAEPTGQKTLAATMNVYVFPTEGQAADVQSKHEAECYTWAVRTTNNDPFELAKRAQQEQMTAEQRKEAAAQAGQGAGAAGAVKGAAVGALIGEIADNDAGGGAAWGAAAGLIAGRRRARQTQRQAQSQAEEQARRQQELTGQDIENFKKAFSVCLEAKDYLVRF